MQLTHATQVPTETISSNLWQYIPELRKAIIKLHFISQLADLSV